MKLYSVYARPGDAHFESAVFVPHAFSWSAFVFTGFWALAQRMWIVAAVLFAASILPDNAAFVASLGTAVMAGMFAAELRQWSLRRRGFTEVGQAAGADLEEAEVLFYTNPPELPTFTSQVSGKTAGADPLGLFDQA
jgi:hypothetical protein